MSYKGRRGCGGGLLKILWKQHSEKDCWSFKLWDFSVSFLGSNKEVAELDNGKGVSDWLGRLWWIIFRRLQTPGFGRWMGILANPLSPATIAPKFLMNSSLDGRQHTPNCTIFFFCCVFLCFNAPNKSLYIESLSCFPRTFIFFQNYKNAYFEDAEQLMGHYPTLLGWTIFPCCWCSSLKHHQPFGPNIFSGGISILKSPLNGTETQRRNTFSSKIIVYDCSKTWKAHQETRKRSNMHKSRFKRF